MFTCDLNVYICAVFFLVLSLLVQWCTFLLSEIVSLLLICFLCIRCLEAQ